MMHEIEINCLDGASRFALKLRLSGSTKDMLDVFNQNTLERCAKYPWTVILRKQLILVERLI